MRLDSYLFEKGFAQSRNKAAELIKEGSVWLNGKVERKNSSEVGENDTIEVEKIAQYVSRAGLKLRGFINELALNVKDADVLDIGSSTVFLSPSLLPLDGPGILLPNTCFVIAAWSISGSSPPDSAKAW